MTEFAPTELTPITGFEATEYRWLASRIVWVGSHGPWHPRALHIARPLIEKCPKSIDGWASSGTLLDETLSEMLAKHTPRGFGALLTGTPLPFPLSARTSDAHGLIAALADDEAQTFQIHAARLMGVGTGLTPSGDDFVGAALFARRHLPGFDSPWQETAHQLVSVAQQRTHLIAAALFSDLCAGESFAPLHGLMSAIAVKDSIAAREQALALINIGSSSGWDMLAGLVATLNPARFAHPQFSSHHTSFTSHGLTDLAISVHP